MSLLQLWWRAARPQTLLLSIGPILLGNGLAAQNHFYPPVFALSLSTAVLLQLLTNFANDYGDTESGVDKHRPGARRLLQSGQISFKQVRLALYFLTSLSLLSGSLLIILSNLPWQSKLLFFALGGISVIAAICYTLGKKPYGYKGLGDLSVFLFFGLIAVAGTFYLQSQRLPCSIWLPATAAGLLSVGVLNINNIRDLGLDQAAGKKTFALYLGKRRALNYFSLGWLTALALTVLFALLTAHYWTLSCLILTPFLLRLDRQLRQTRKFAQYNQRLAEMVTYTFIYELLLVFGVLLN